MALLRNSWMSPGFTVRAGSIRLPLKMDFVSPTKIYGEKKDVTNLAEVYEMNRINKIDGTGRIDEKGRINNARNKACAMFLNPV